MFAIIAAGAKQYLVRENDEIFVEKIAGEVGDEIIINKVLAINTKVGRPTLPGATVVCKIEKQGKQKKINVIKHLSQKHHMRKYGHRQPYTKLKIIKIVESSKE
ncbi:50S ribosomal protein L21 [[Mycoplasma] testudinis]|uniref:50S ribosomal protein L21 n=1 Tax=[Mycoplasma] testudinis TaxID=33924 RepID=UPI000482B1CD|nr:50S ribosomal protein L21 [[Mycoplasma] testudinis]